MSGGGYDSSYGSMGKERKLDLSKAYLEIVTGRGTNSRRLGKGSMAVMCHIAVRFLVGKATAPYDGAQQIPIYGLSAAGLRLLERIAVEKHRASVSNILLIVIIMLTMIFRLLMRLSMLFQCSTI